MVNYDPHRWMDHFFDIRGSMLREIAGRVLLFGCWTALVVAFHKYCSPVAISTVVHTLVGLALGLLLVFRTNASYDRFWEGRKLWGGIVNETRNLARSSFAFLAAAPEARRKIALWTVAFPHACMHQLRGTKSDLGPRAGELDPEELAEVLKSDHPPLAIAARISAILQKEKVAGRITDYAQVNVDQNVQLLIDYIGGCERIHKTPLPFAYVVHLRRALVIYCMSLPFALVETFGWGTIVDVLFVAYVFFGIEEIGVEIEDPFGHDDNDLPLEAICATIDRNVMSLQA